MLVEAMDFELIENYFVVHCKLWVVDYYKPILGVVNLVDILMVDLVIKGTMYVATVIAKIVRNEA